MRYPPYKESNVNRLLWLTGKSMKRTPTDLLYFPGLLLGFLGNFAMKVNTHVINIYRYIDIYKVNF